MNMSVSTKNIYPPEFNMLENESLRKLIQLIESCCDQDNPHGHSEPEHVAKHMQNHKFGFACTWRAHVSSSTTHHVYIGVLSQQA